MTKEKILEQVVAAHNLVAQVCVSGDNAILVGDALRCMRVLCKQLQDDMKNASMTGETSQKEE